MVLFFLQYTLSGKKDGENNYCLTLPPRKKKKKKGKALYLCVSKCCVQTLHANAQEGLKIFCFFLILHIHAHVDIYYM